MVSSSLMLTCVSIILCYTSGVTANIPLPVPVSSATKDSLPETLTIDMPVDHFNSYDTRTYKNRYWINDTFYREGGPIFFYDAGEGGVTERTISLFLGAHGALLAPLRLAERFHGMAIVWEHRFYGESPPFAIDNVTGHALAGYDAYKYLNNEQALEDAVYFANNFEAPGHQKGSFSPSKTPWIWVGASYPGARGAMIRLRNPETFYASWASSAPVQAQVDMSVYFKPIQQSMPANCSNDVHAAITYADETLLNGAPEEVSTLKRAIFLASVANPFSNMTTEDPANAGTLDYYDIAVNLSYVFAGTTRPHKPFQYLGYGGSLGAFCDYLESWNPKNASDFTVTTTGTDWLHNTADNKPIDNGIAATFGTEVAFYAFLSATVKKSLRDFGSTGHTFSAPDYVSWTWQYCSEFGFFQDSNATDPANMISRFSNVTSYAQNECRDIFDHVPDFPDVDKILKYGGYKMTPSNVMFTNGELDPWRTLGVQADKKINPSAIIRESTTDIPACKAPPAGNKVFGQVYPGEVHGSDIGKTAAEAEQGKTTSADVGFDLFSKALDVWLECFGK
jgi:Serine carboxypeptidase S28